MTEDCQIVPIVVQEEYSLHGDTPFCYDLKCPCHADHDKLQTLHDQWNDGLVESEHGIADIWGGRVV